MDIILSILIFSLLLENTVLAMRYSPSELGLSRLLFPERSKTQDGQRLAEACFVDYIENSNGNSENYGKDYSRCSEQSTRQRNQVDQEAVEEQRAIVSASERLCTMVGRCNKFNNSLELLRCHAAAGANNVKVSYSISSNTSDYVALLQERYRDVVLYEEKCHSVAKRVFVHRTANNYDRLQNCLDARLQAELDTAINSSTKKAITNSNPEAATTEMEVLISGTRNTPEVD